MADEDPPAEAASDTKDSYFSLLDQPRIRDITGVRIHQLTLPQSLALVSKFIPSPSPGTEFGGYELGESSRSVRRPSTASLDPSRKDRRLSATRHERSSSVSSLGPPSPATTRSRITRPRAPTLAGEALEHAHDPQSTRREAAIVEDEESNGPASRLARCFVAFKLLPPAPAENQESVPFPQPKRSNSDHLPPSKIRPGAVPDLSRASSPRSLSTPSNPDGKSRASPPSRSPVASPPTTPVRIRTISLTTSASKTSPHVIRRTLSHAAEERKSQLARVPSRLGEGSTRAARPSIPSPRDSTRSLQPHRPSLQVATRSADTVALAKRKDDQLEVPFFVSPIHNASTNPRFLSLSPETDFASWLTIESAAATTLRVEVWVEDDAITPVKWRKLEGLGGSVDLSDLRPVSAHTQLPPNILQFTLSSDDKHVFYLPPKEQRTRSTSAMKRHTAGGVLERSKRETRMKKGSTLSALHQLVNIQAVITDTQRGIQAVQKKIDALLLSDVNHQALRRDIDERESRVECLRDRISEVRKSSAEVRARTTLAYNENDRRRENLRGAEVQDDLLSGVAGEKEAAIELVLEETSALRPAIHLLRSQHVQKLDALFPIVPLDPARLLYTILDVPLPIPTSPKEPAPPLTLPAADLPEGVKVDERSTSAALGYVAMVLQLLGGLNGVSGGLPYPVTCAGSRSLVKDVVSVMQGPRSFPLYARGVERYRFEYAVFLLNKNIELLMQEASVRMLDLRHTLPNLKALLLTLSSPSPPPPPTLGRSTTSSRQTSRAWSFSQMPTSPGSPGTSEAGRAGGLASPGSSRGINTPSPLGRRIQRGRAIRGSLGRAMSPEAAEAEEEEDEKVTRGALGRVGSMMASP